MNQESWIFDGELQRRRNALTDSGYDVYCLFCMTGKEIRAACALNQKYNQFLIMPFLRMMHKSRNGERYLSQDVLLKGYVFLFVPRSASISEIENDPDVYYVLERKNGAGKLREADLRYAKWVLEMDGLLKASKAVRIGERVKIVEGPLLTLEGDIKEYTYGSGGRDSCSNTAEAVTNLLYGIGVDHYVSLTMDAVALLSDLTGGVQLTMLEDFSAFDPAMQKGAVVILKGEQALTYVRTRKGLDDSTNLRRMERQRQYLNALRLNVQTCMEQDDTFAIHAILELSAYMVSDCTVEQLSKLWEEAEAYQGLGIVALEGESVRGEEYMEFYVDEDRLKSLMINSFYEPYEEERPS